MDDDETQAAREAADSARMDNGAYRHFHIYYLAMIESQLNRIADALERTDS